MNDYQVEQLYRFRDALDDLEIHRGTLGELILESRHSNLTSLTSSGKPYPVSFIYEVTKNFSTIFARQWCVRLEQLLSKEDLDELNCQQWVFEHQTLAPPFLMA